MSLVFQNIDPPPPAICGGGGGEDTLAGRRGEWGSIFGKTRDIGLTSYSNNLSTSWAIGWGRRDEALPHLPPTLSTPEAEFMKYNLLRFPGLILRVRRLVVSV
jgi:hypothetical protein